MGILQFSIHRGSNFVNRQKVEAYLAHKWQLENRLPELHPYYNTPPSFGGTQSITWLGLDGVDEDALPKLPVKAANDADFTLTAVASSGLPVIYSSSDPTILAIADNQAKIIGPGKVTISAYQTGNTRFFAAPTEAVTLQIVIFRIQTLEKIPRKSSLVLYQKRFGKIHLSKFRQWLNPLEKTILFIDSLLS